MGYVRKGSASAVILALEGAQGVGGCWAPRGDWLVFKSGKQLLPKYVVYY